MLETTIKEQLRGIFADLQAHYTFAVRVKDTHEHRTELIELLSDVADCSDHINVHTESGDALEFSILKEGKPTGIFFRGIPSGHEFTSLLLAVLNSDGKGKNLPDAFIAGRIAALKGQIRLVTYVSLTCTNCPDIVQALNVMALLHHDMSHTMVDGALYQDEANALKLQGVPAVFADGEQIHVGRGTLSDLLTKLETKYGVQPAEQPVETRNYDVVVIGAGPSGAAAAVYSARKGLKVAVLAERVGGQVKETVGIENLISVPYTTGANLANNLQAHMEAYPVDIFEHRVVESVSVDGEYRTVHLQGGEQVTAPVLIIATGAGWRRLNVTGESAYIGRGVAFCPHCDGPFYKGKHVAVVGGGNSGIEAAIDLAGICSRVTIIEFLETLKADSVLQKKAESLANVEIILNTQTTEVVGDGEKVTAIRIKNRATQQEETITLDGIFVQIGLIPNSVAFKDLVEVNRLGEIVTDERCHTSVKGIYAAGDVTSVPYKQIIIAMGEGAKAALSAFEDRMRL
ncbi:MAG: alkyl hydroperoxide reductase subunit F [Prevotellaceae bacterium]|jgi:alkyl hydroperoxide reductase subunit F|nr:alkyl hydroperoxide reductase subunit F [Prevotellaceae bacterium]